nr:hypothetical protein [Tanacetum cinerariifolium]
SYNISVILGYLDNDFQHTQDLQSRVLELRRRKEKSLDSNNSFLGEYECSSLAPVREERRDEKEVIGSLETRSNNIAQSGMNMGQDRQLQMVGGNGGNQFRHTDVSNQVRQNAIQNLSIQNVRNQNGLIVIPRIANSNVNLNGNENVVAARAEGNCNGNNGNQISYYNYKGSDSVADSSKGRSMNTTST